jgi:hypothetical protein
LNLGKGAAEMYTICKGVVGGGDVSQDDKINILPTSDYFRWCFYRF